MNRAGRCPVAQAGLQAGLLLALILALGGCAGNRPTEDRLPAQWYPASAEGQAETLLILLPGARDRGDGFYQEGVIELIRAQRPDWDLVTVDAHLGYYRERSFVDRLGEDIVRPALASGYRELWLSGPSLGGFGSLLYLCLGDADAVSGVIVLAPFLGGGGILRDIERAGGPMDWVPGGAGRDFERELWACLRDGVDADIWLGWGRSDRMGRGNQLLAELLPEERILVIEGGHRWSTWRELWLELLERKSDQGRTPR
ncbi:MAG: alpha/beta hydrolase [Wenzhouxiangellaceae bacterium]|nr:MAG: alpha/beta hydrolase [Wenzhouxiangellaceae bacterium]